MEKRTLNARPRSVVGKQAKALRRQGLIPAVLYGQGSEPQTLEVVEREANRVLAHASGSTLIELSVEETAHQVLVREIQRDPIRRDLIHIDFLRVAMDEAITASVPLEIVGEAPAVKTHGGVLVTGLDEIEVEALPADLPDRISVDLGSLKEIGQSIVVGDLALDRGVKLLTSPAEMVVRVMSQVAEEVEEVEVVAEAAEPEVIEKRKEEMDEDEEPERGKEKDKEKK